MTVQIYRKLVKFLSIFPYMALSSQRNAFEMKKILDFLWLFYKQISFSSSVQKRSHFLSFLLFFYRKLFTPDVALFAEKKLK